MATRIGLIAGNGRFPLLFAEAAKKQGLEVIAIGHRGETEPSLERLTHAFEWVRIGQINRIVSTLRRYGVTEAVMAGGFGRMKAFADARPDLGALKIVSRLRSFRDDALLREIARFFEEARITIAAPTAFVPQVLAPEGHLAGPKLGAEQRRDVELGVEVATLLGKADVGQTVVVRGGHVLALEAVEGTDETIRRAGKLGGAGATVVKLCKPGQDERFDLPAVGLRTLEVMGETGANVLAVEAGRSVLLDGDALFAAASQRSIAIIGIARR